MGFSFRALVVAAMLAGAGLPASAPARAQQFEIEPTDFLSAAGSIGGAFFIMSATLFELFNKEIDGLSYAIVPGGSISNGIAVGRGDTQFGFAFAIDLIAATKGIEPYNAPIDGLRAIMNVNYNIPLHIWIASDMAFDTVGALAGAQEAISIDTGPRGTGSELLGSRMLDAHGLGYKKIRDLDGSITNSHVREAVERFKDGHIDALSYAALVGDPLFVDLVSARDVRLISMDETVVETLAATYGYRPATIPAGSYAGQDAAARTIEFATLFIVNEAVPEDVVYAMTKLAFEHREDLAITHRALASLDPTVGAEVPIPLHPGAERYYREIGVIQ